MSNSFVRTVALHAMIFVASGLLGLTTLQAQASGGPPVSPAEPTNRLIHERSPYLLQHAHNPVDWYPWGEEAFAKARKENKPISSRSVTRPAIGAM